MESRKVWRNKWTDQYQDWQPELASEEESLIPGVWMTEAAFEKEIEKAFEAASEEVKTGGRFADDQGYTSKYASAADYLTDLKTKKNV